MKSILTEYTVPVVRNQRFTTNSLDHLQESYKEAIQALLSSVQIDPYTVAMLSNNVLSENGNDVTVIAGWGTYGNEIFQVDAQIISIAEGKKAVWKIEETFAAHDPAQFTDGNTFNIHSIKKLKLFEDDAGNGLTDWNVTQYFNDPWHNLTLEAGWIQHPGSPVYLQNGTPTFRKDRSGNLQLAGVLQSLDGQGNDLIAVLPEGYRPSRNFTLSSQNIGNTYEPLLMIFANGEIRDVIRDNAQSNTVNLSGASVPLE